MQMIQSLEQQWNFNLIFQVKTFLNMQAFKTFELEL